MTAVDRIKNYFTDLFDDSYEAPEFISESEHLDNLIVIRELFKIDINDWIQDLQSNKVCTDEEVVESLKNLRLVENCIIGINSQLKNMELINERISSIKSQG